MNVSAAPARTPPNLPSALAELHAVLADADMSHAIPLLSEASVRAAIP